MSGHSKFANIKHKKEKNDAAKGKMFTIIGKEIAVAVKEGGADPDNNSKLRDVIAKAKAKIWFKQPPVSAGIASRQGRAKHRENGRYSSDKQYWMVDEAALRRKGRQAGAGRRIHMS